MVTTEFKKISSHVTLNKKIAKFIVFFKRLQTKEIEWKISSADDFDPLAPGAIGLSHVIYSGP